MQKGDKVKHKSTGLTGVVHWVSPITGLATVEWDRGGPKSWGFKPDDLVLVRNYKVVKVDLHIDGWWVDNDFECSGLTFDDAHSRTRYEAAKLAGLMQGKSELNIDGAVCVICA